MQISLIELQISAKIADICKYGINVKTACHTIMTSLASYGVCTRCKQVPVL